MPAALRAFFDKNNFHDYRFQVLADRVSDGGFFIYLMLAAGAMFDLITQPLVLAATMVPFVLPFCFALGQIRLMVTMVEQTQ